MKHILLTISLIFGATAVSADTYRGKDAIKIITRGEIVNEQFTDDNSIKLPNYFKYLTVIKGDDAYLCSLEMKFNSDSGVSSWLRAICSEVGVIGYN